MRRRDLNRLKVEVCYEALEETMLSTTYPVYTISFRDVRSDDNLKLAIRDFTTASHDETEASFNNTFLISPSQQFFTSLPVFFDSLKTQSRRFDSSSLALDTSGEKKPQTLKVTGLTLSWSSSFWKDMTTLSLKNIETQYQPSISDLLNILDSSPYLRRLALEFAGPVESADPIKTSSLPYLQNLVIRGLDVQVCNKFLKHLVLDNLANWNIDVDSYPIRHPLIVFRQLFSSFSEIEKAVFTFYPNGVEVGIKVRSTLDLERSVDRPEFDTTIRINWGEKTIFSSSHIIKAIHTVAGRIVHCRSTDIHAVPVVTAHSTMKTCFQADVILWRQVLEIVPTTGSLSIFLHPNTSEAFAETFLMAFRQDVMTFSGATYLCPNSHDLLLSGVKCNDIFVKELVETLNIRSASSMRLINLSLQIFGRFILSDKNEGILRSLLVENKVDEQKNNFIKSYYEITPKEGIKEKQNVDLDMDVSFTSETGGDISMISDYSMLSEADTSYD